MATDAVIKFGKRHQHLLGTPVLEVGVPAASGMERFSPRELYPKAGPDDFVSVDLFGGQDGPGIGELSLEELGGQTFRSVHCHGVLEHVPAVRRVAEAIERVLEPGGWLYVSVPFAWRIHRIPVDLWRFTPQGIDYLFPFVAFHQDRSGYSLRSGRFWPLDLEPELPLGDRLESWGKPTAVAMKAIRKLRLADGLFSGERALLFESHLMMIGQRVEEPSYSLFSTDFIGRR